MSCDAVSKPEPQTTPPYGAMQIFLIEHNYRELGCDRWNTTRVRRLCLKLGEPHAVVAARMRIRTHEFERRIREDSWTRQDGLILTILEREVDFQKGGTIPAGPLVQQEPSP